MVEWIETKVGGTVRPRGYLTSPASSGMVLQPTQLNPTERTYTSGSSPPGYAYDDNEFTFDGTGIVDVDLTDLTDVEGVALDGTNMKLQWFRMQCPTTNSGQAAIQRGAAQPYPLGSDLSDVGMPVYPGGRLEMEFYDSLSDISNTVKNLRFTGTIGDTFSVEFVIG